MIDTGGGELRKSLSRFDAAMIVVGTIIGVGIFFNPTRVAAAVGSPLAALACWAAGGVIALLGSITYAQLGILLPYAGGPYVFLREGLGRLWAFLYGWICLTAIVSGALAVIGHIFVDYLEVVVGPVDTLAAPVFAWINHVLVDVLHVASKPVAFDANGAFAALTLALLTAVNVVGVRLGSGLNNVFSVLKIVTLVALVVAALAYGHEPVLTTQGTHDATFGGVVSAMVGILFTVAGWQNLNNVASEMKDAKKDLPPAIRWGVVLVVGVVLLANASYLRLLPFQHVATTQTLYADALRQAWGETGAKLAALAIACSAFGILCGLMLSTPRIYYAMAKDRLLPAPFAIVHHRFKTPVVAIVVQGVLAIGLAFWASVGQLTDYCVFADWLFFALNGIALLVMRRRIAEARALARGPLERFAPWVFTAIAIVVTGCVFVERWSAARFGLAWLVVGTIVCVVGDRRKRGAAVTS